MATTTLTRKRRRAPVHVRAAKAVTTALPTRKAARKTAGRTAGKAKDAATTTPAKGLALLGAAGGLAAFLKRRNAKAAEGTGVPVEPPVTASPAVSAVPEPSAAEVRADGTL